MRAVLRRAETPTTSPDQAVLKIDDRLSVDFNRREVIVEGEHIKLRPTEYRLLYHLIENAGWTVPARAASSEGVGLRVSRRDALRPPVRELPAREDRGRPVNPKYILTEQGVGYRFVDFKNQNV